MHPFAFCLFFCIMLSEHKAVIRIMNRGLKTQRKVIPMNEAQARRLVETYADMILRISYQYLKHTMDAEDICQTVFLKYLTAKPRFESLEHEKAWMIRTTINTCKDHLKSAFFRRTVPFEEAANLAAPAVPESGILPALQSLPEMYRICLYLYYYEDYTGKEIAGILGKSESAVSQYLSRGRQKLRKLLSEEERSQYA